MKFCHSLACCLTLCIYSAGHAQTPLRYSLAWEPDHLQVSLNYKPVESDSTVFVYGMPPFGGQNDIFSAIQNIHVDQPASVAVVPADRKIIVRFNGADEVHLHYTIVDTWNDSRDTRGELFRPIFWKDYLYIHSLNLFLQPMFRAPKPGILQEVSWTKRPDYPLFQSFDPANPGTRPYTASTESFMISLITGARDLSVKEIHFRGIRNYLVLRQHPDSRFPDDVAHFFEQYNRASRKYWNDYDDTYYSLVLQPLTKSRRAMTGIAMANGFLGKYSGDSLLSENQLAVLAHEVSHHWTGVGMSMSMENQWFNEGFTDYISWTTLLASGIFTPEQFTRQINDACKKLYVSDVRNTPNDQVFANYWKMGDYNRLPYWRGSLFALYLDLLVRNQHPNKSLHHVMIDLFSFLRKQPAGFEFTPQVFFVHLNKYLPAIITQQAYERHILRGETIRFDELTTELFTITDQQGTPSFTITSPSAVKAAYRIR